MAVDPVCGLEVDEDSAAGKSWYQGKFYYFSTSACKKAFDENPEIYVKPKES